MNLDQLYANMDDTFDDALLNGIKKSVAPVSKVSLNKEFTQSQSSTSGITAYGTTRKTKIKLRSK